MAPLVPWIQVKDVPPNEVGNPANSNPTDSSAEPLPVNAIVPVADALSVVSLGVPAVSRMPPAKPSSDTLVVLWPAMVGAESLSTMVAVALSLTVWPRLVRVAPRVKVSLASSNRSFENAGQTMQRVVESVDELSRLMGAIAQATAQQRASAQELDRAVGSLNESAQQSMSVVQRSQDTAARLREQAQDLDETMGAFRA